VRCPGRNFWKNEIRRVVRDHPALAETNWASDNDIVRVEDAAYTERVLRFVFRAVGHFIAEGAKALCAMAIRGDTNVA